MRKGSRTWAERALRRQHMSPEQARLVVTAQDPEVVRRHLELHREWLQERLAERLRALDDVERALTAGPIPGRGDLGRAS